jgi:hypothetical protein
MDCFLGSLLESRSFRGFVQWSHPVKVTVNSNFDRYRPTFDSMFPKPDIRNLVCLTLLNWSSSRWKDTVATCHDTWGTNEKTRVFPETQLNPVTCNPSRCWVSWFSVTSLGISGNRKVRYRSGSGVDSSIIPSGIPADRAHISEFDGMFSIVIN